jgi:hypothetical protein
MVNILTQERRAVEETDNYGTELKNVLMEVATAMVDMVNCTYKSIGPNDLLRKHSEELVGSIRQYMLTATRTITESQV